jgi:cation transport ATPase
VVHGILMASALGALVFLGGDLVRSAWESVRQRRIGIDLLFLVTLAGAFAGSLVNTFTGAGSVYYEVVAILIVVHTIGKMLGARSRVAALRAVDEMREKFEFCDLVHTDGSATRVRVGALAPGARVRVAPGGAIAVDGEIVSGLGYVQEASMTGEWRPAPRGPGDRVLAGTFSVDGFFEILSAGGQRRLDAILDVVSHARLAPSQLQQQADRLMAWFFPLVVGVSMATFAWWLAAGPWDRALFNAMAVLLVACPCAMGLATPVAVWGGLARLAEGGLVARTGDFLDALSRVDLLCIDKTGTLSTDTLSVRAWKIEPAFREREIWLKAAVAAVEHGLPHPIAEALRGTAIDDGMMGIRVTERRIEPGRGVVASIRDVLGATIDLAVGELELGGNGVLPAATEGKLVYVFVDGERVASVELEERWRDGLSETFDALRGLEIEVEVLSGDGSAAAAISAHVHPRPTATPQAVCNIIRYKPFVRSKRAAGENDGVEILGGLTPAKKHARVEERVGAGRTVLFVGDGINDAAAMSAAQASIAMGGGAALARASAMAVFVGDDLRFLPRAICLARATRRSIRTNLLFASGYNLAGMALAAAGVLHPVAAALLMLGSSVFVSVNSIRAVRGVTLVGR